MPELYLCVSRLHIQDLGKDAVEIHPPLIPPWSLAFSIPGSGIKREYRHIWD